MSVKKCKTAKNAQPLLDKFKLIIQIFTEKDLFITVRAIQLLELIPNRWVGANVSGNDIKRLRKRFEDTGKFYFGWRLRK